MDAEERLFIRVQIGWSINCWCIVRRIFIVGHENIVSSGEMNCTRDRLVLFDDLDEVCHRKIVLGLGENRGVWPW